MEIQGKIKLIGETQSIGSNGFRKRELVVTTVKPFNPTLRFINQNRDLLARFEKTNE